MLLNVGFAHLHRNKEMQECSRTVNDQRERIEK